MGGKLPSNRQVLSVLFYNIRTQKMSKTESADLVIEEVKVFWRKSRIPTQQNARCVAKLIKLHQTHRQIIAITEDA